jgi:hypothetical protein
LLHQPGEQVIDGQKQQAGHAEHRVFDRTVVRQPECPAGKWRPDRSGEPDGSTTSRVKIPQRQTRSTLEMNYGGGPETHRHFYRVQPAAALGSATIGAAHGGTKNGAAKPLKIPASPWLARASRL